MKGKRLPVPSDSKVRVVDIELDDVNANDGRPRGMEMLRESVADLGYGRSIVAVPTATGGLRVKAGNKTFTVARERGLRDSDIHVVRTRGDKLIVHVREDLAENDPRALDLALRDNAVAEANLNWNADNILKAEQAGVDVSRIWDAKSLVRMHVRSKATPGENDDDEVTEVLTIELDCSSKEQQDRLMEEFWSRGLTCRASSKSTPKEVKSGDEESDQRKGKTYRVKRER